MGTERLDPAADGALLESATHTVSAYPECGEAVVQTCGMTREDRLATLLRRGDQFTLRGAGNRERSEKEAARRAAGKVRRWCVRNQADRMITLTMRPEVATDDLGEAWRICDTFRRRMREAGQDCVLLVPERHKSGRIHFHGAIPKWIDHSVLEACWGAGFVLISKPRTVGKCSKRERSRIMAAYLSKYLAKSFEDEGQTASAGSPSASSGCATAFNGKRYSTSRGTQPRKVNRSVCSFGEAVYAARDLLDVQEVELIWSSREVEDWEGPPTWMFRSLEGR